MRSRSFAAIAAAALVTATLAACTGMATATDDAPASPSASGTASSAPVAAVKLYPDGTAAENKPFFDATTKALVAKRSMPGGKAVVDALVAAGFDVGAMQVSPDKTSIDLDAEAIYFSVKIKGECLIGQIGASFGYHSILADPISTGACLIGTTRDIDWNPKA